MEIKKVMSDRQAAFVREYCIDKNGTQAAIRAGYSRRTANEQASRLLAKANIRTAVDVALATQAKKTETSSEWVRRRLKEEAENFGKGSSPAARVRAVELIGKLNGDFVEDRRNLRSPLQDFDTADLERLAAALASPDGPERTTH